VVLQINHKNTRDWVPDYASPANDPLQVYLTNMGHADTAFMRVINKDAVNDLIKTGKLDKNAMEAFKQITKTSAELRASKA
jgi:hypothetical protein